MNTLALLLITLFILILAFPILINYIIAKKFEKIAFQKGFDRSVHSFAMCFWLGFIGYIYVMALPDISKRNINSEASNADFTCPTCKSDITKEEKYCHNCGQSLLWD